jgi:hypothetical protein
VSPYPTFTAFMPRVVTFFRDGAHELSRCVHTWTPTGSPLQIPKDVAKRAVTRSIIFARRALTGPALKL